MQFKVSNKITVINPTKEMIDYCKSELVLDNPEYVKKQRMGLWCGNIPREIHLYEKDGSNLILPFGCIGYIYRAYSKKCDFERQIAPTRDFRYDSYISLYDYQEQALHEAISRRNGVIVMPCGAGKTQVGLELIARLGVKALWLTHTQDLLNQSMNRAKSMFGCNAKSYGTITGGKVNIGEGLTFATVQTMSKIDLTQYKDTWDCIIVDECHKAIGSPTKCMMFYKVLSALSCRYKFGLTATPKRADGLERCMYALIGDIVSKIPKSAVKDTTSEVHVKYIDTGWTPNIDVVLAGDGTINYSNLIDDMVSNEDRLNTIVDVINSLDGPTLVLANRVQYLVDMRRKYNGKSICLSSLGGSKSAREIRKKSLVELNSGDIDCVFATYQLAKEGLDCPNLRYVVFATPEKDPTTIEQSAGRVGRKAEGKEYGTVIDFVDSFGLFDGWMKKRNSIYKKLDFVLT